MAAPVLAPAALTLLAEPAIPMMPFAQGPLATASTVQAAIAQCRAPARIIQTDGVGMVLLAVHRTEKAFNCLSLWIAAHPDAGYRKMGFVGVERR